MLAVAGKGAWARTAGCSSACGVQAAAVPRAVGLGWCRGADLEARLHRHAGVVHSLGGQSMLLPCCVSSGHGPGAWALACHTSVSCKY